MCWTAGSGSAEVALLPRAVFVGGPEAAGGKSCTEVAICKVKPRVRATITPAQVSSASRFFHALCSSCTGKYFLGLTQRSLLTCIPRICTNPAPCKKASGTSKQGMALLYLYTPQPSYLTS